MSMKKMKTFAVNGEQFEIMDEFARNNNNNNNFMQNNLLINSNFADPVNQRGFVYGAPVTASGYCIDRWMINVNNPLLSSAKITKLGNSFLMIGSFVQKTEITKLGKYTISAKIDGTVHSATLEFDTTYKSATINDHIEFALSTNNVLSPAIIFYQEANVEWVKCEEGENATPYVPRLRAEELLLCQRYYQILPARTSKLYYVGANDVKFVRDFNVPMRVPPTCTGGGALAVNMGDQTGWAADLSDANAYCVYILFTKDSHGLKYSDCLSLNGWIKADAEL